MTSLPPTAYCSLLAAYGSLGSGFGFIAKLFFDCLTHQLRRGIWIEALKMFHDAAIARNDKTLGYHRLAGNQLHQRTFQLAIVKNDLVRNTFRLNILSNLGLILVVR